MRPFKTFSTTALNRAAMLALVTGLAACGGGGDQQSSAADAALNFVKQIPVADASGVPVRALAATGVVNAGSVLDWLEYKFPLLLPKSASTGSVSLQSEGISYTVRAYFTSAGARYVAISTAGDVYALGDFTGNQVQGLGNFSAVAALVRADECSVYPGRCGSGGGNEPKGPLNVCTMSAQQALVPGNKGKATYVYSGYTTGQFTSTIEVEGPATFEGQAAIRTAETITGSTTSAGETTQLNISNKSYDVARSDGFINSLGSESQVSIGGFALTTKLVYNPADVNSEFSLTAGQSFSKPTSLTTTSSPIGGSGSSTSSTTYSFEGLETITVLGKSYATCRYVQTQSSIVIKAWYIQGKGIPARIEETTTEGGTTRTTLQELVSGDINGQPL